MQGFTHTYLYHVVDDYKWDHDGQEYRSGVDDNENSGEDAEECTQPVSNPVRQHEIDRFDVAREPVEDAADRRRVEEHHRNAQDVGQHPRV